MKRLLALVLIAVVSVSVYAGDPDALSTITFSSVSTNIAAATTDTATTGSCWGWFDTVIFDIGGQTNPAPICTVAIVTVADRGSGPARTILSALPLSADGSYPIRDIVTGQNGSDISNVPCRIPLMNDRLTVQAYASNATNVTANPITLGVRLILSDEN